MASHLSEWSALKMLVNTWRKRVHSYTIGNNADGCSHYGKQYENFSKK